MEEMIKANLGRRIREARELSGLTQAEFAARAGYDRNFLGRLERGQQNPTVTTLAHIAAACSMTISQLTDGIERAQP